MQKFTEIIRCDTTQFEITYGNEAQKKRALFLRKLHEVRRASGLPINEIVQVLERFCEELDEETYLGATKPRGTAL